ncbi:MAG TPA: tetratricopeptide repeat protein [Candidatus Krumholzibacteria bacterium]|nr:tetratricopeptide repeat protein [Candidatus Krumholzibacteria bacterium]HPD71412.1 tetratricopeptide repeat protein [Candidatus Krumholzibacteria bacterium]HRY41655.1 tetratricopeptide repeat protein [Candidatus Krumholzibacteria bacterium]
MTAQSIDQSPNEATPAGFVDLVAEGRQALARGDLDQARACFETATRQFPAEPVGHNNLGAFYMGLGEYAAAERSFAESATLLPDNPNIRFNLALARFRREAFAAAAADFAAVAAVAPTDAEVRNNLGAASFLAGDLDVARRNFEAALELQPNYPSAVLNLCDLEYATGNAAGAIGLCEAYLEHQHDLGVLRRLLEMLDDQARRAVDLAIPRAEALAAASGSDLATRRQLGRLLEARQALTAKS